MWELLDMFIGLLQAPIFTILTIIYFGEAVADNEASPH
jgi:F0F1-type ATP synthase membrane subunit a